MNAIKSLIETYKIASNSQVFRLDKDMMQLQAEQAAAELAELQADNARLRLVESAARKLLAANPTQRWTVDEMNALDEALNS